MIPAAFDPGAWVRLADAARAGYPKRSLLRHVEDGKIPSRRNGSAVEVAREALPAEVRARLDEMHATLTERPTAEQVADAGQRMPWLDERTRAAMLAEACRRGRLLERFRDTHPKMVNGAPSPEVLELCAAWAATDPVVLAARPSWANPVTKRHLVREFAAWQGGGIMALLPQAPRLTADDPRRKPFGPRVEKLVLQLRLVELKHATTQGLWRELKKRLQGSGESVPSLSSLRRWLAAHVPEGVSNYHRQGPRTFNARSLQPVIRTYDGIDVGQWWSGDHRAFDFEVIDPTGGGLVRPWVTMFLDIKSRCPIGWSISVAPSSRTIAEAFIHGVRPKRGDDFQSLYGRPEFVYIDNGKDFRARVLEGHKTEHVAVEGLFVAAGSRVVHATPYNARAKVVERFFGTMSLQFDRAQPTWLGNTPSAKPETIEALRAEHERWRRGEVERSPFLTLAELEVKFTAWVAEYMRQPHEGLSEHHGEGRTLTPLLVAGWRRSAPVVANETTLIFHAMPSRRVKVRQATIRIEGEPYQHADLWRLDGQTVDVRWSRSRPEVAYVFDAKGELRLVAEHQAGVKYAADGLDTDELFRAAAKRRKEQRKAVRQVVAARHYEALGMTHLDQVAREQRPQGPAPTTPASTAEALPREAVPAIGRLDRLAAQAAAAASQAQAPAAPAAPPADESDDAFLARVIGPRPALPAVYDELTKRRVARDQADWDVIAASFLDERRRNSAAKGDPR